LDAGGGGLAVFADEGDGGLDFGDDASARKSATSCGTVRVAVCQAYQPRMAVAVRLLRPEIGGSVVRARSEVAASGRRMIFMSG
jgi:hypothetical protein